jgi:hypothetical protein
VSGVSLWRPDVDPPRCRREHADSPGGMAEWTMATLLLPSIGLLVGGISLIAAGGGGLYWVLGAILLAFVSASVNAWVLLVEIKR